MSLNSLGLVGLLMRSMPDARGALRALVNSLQIHSQGAVTTLEDDGRVAVLSYNAIDPTIEATDQTGDGAVAMMLNVMRELCGPDFQAIEASFAHRQPANIKPFQRFFRVPLYFNAAHFALAFSSDWLDVPVPYADADLQRLLEKQIDVIKSRRGMQFPDQVRDVLRSALLTNCCSEEKIAALFGIPARTFMRRLKSCETGFQELVDQTRFEMAQLMLTNTSLTIGQIGDLLGYARASTFIRAFRRWSNTTPAAWRKTNLEFSVGDKDSVNG
jgi:AraC-like DNA-binding protein